MRLYKTNFTREYAAYRQATKVEALGLSFEIQSGNDDSVTVYHDKTYIYVISENSRLDYIGIEVISRENGSLEFDIFFDSGSQDDADYLLGLNQYGRKINYMLNWWM